MNRQNLSSLRSDDNKKSFLLLFHTVKVKNISRQTGDKCWAHLQASANNRGRHYSRLHKIIYRPIKQHVSGIYFIKNSMQIRQSKMRYQPQTVLVIQYETERAVFIIFIISLERKTFLYKLFWLDSLKKSIALRTYELRGIQGRSDARQPLHLFLVHNIWRRKKWLYIRSKCVSFSCWLVLAMFIYSSKWT